MSILAAKIHSRNMTTPADIRFVLPYFVDNLPAPLPTQEQIENASDVLAEVAGRRVIRVGEHFVVKYGTNNDEVEAATLIYLSKTKLVNVPKVYAVYRSGPNDALFIIMEYIPGDNLAKVWTCLSTESKEQICRELKLQLDQLRRLPSLGYFGGVGQRPMPDGIFWIHERKTPHINGPFYSETELNDALTEKTLLADEIWSRRGPQRAHFYERMLPTVLRDHACTFTHADFQRKNIIVRSCSNTFDEHDSSEVATFHVTLVDWELSGWYPSYWEFCAASWAFRFDDDWPEYIEKIMDPWPVEYAWLKLMRDSLWA